VVLAAASVEGLMGHKGGQWKDLLLVPTGMALCWVSLLLLRREARETKLTNNDVTPTM